MIDDWWLMNDDWWLMIDEWWLMIDDWWLMIDDLWSMIDDWWLMIDFSWCFDDLAQATLAALREQPCAPLRLTFRYILRRALRDLAWLTFRWLTFSIKYNRWFQFWTFERLIVQFALVSQSLFAVLSFESHDLFSALWLRLWSWLSPFKCRLFVQRSFLHSFVRH